MNKMNDMLFWWDFNLFIGWLTLSHGLFLNPAVDNSGCCLNASAQAVFTKIQVLSCTDYSKAWNPPVAHWIRQVQDLSGATWIFATCVADGLWSIAACSNKSVCIKFTQNTWRLSLVFATWLKLMKDESFRPSTIIEAYLNTIYLHQWLVAGLIEMCYSPQ